jgi:site-specific DNA-methyltransferase (adenine-specific)
MKLWRGNGREHPTQKPVTLLEYLINTYTLEGETVLDNTMGSGSTGVACVNTKRDFIGIEKDDKYFEIACGRIEEAREKRKSNV